MRPVKSFQVRPALPDNLKALEEVAYNLRWSWEHETIALFRRLDPRLWEATGHNPIRMLGSVSQSRLDELSHDGAFLAHLDRVQRDLGEYMGGNGTWYAKRHGTLERPLAAYFSMEFGLTECLPIYSGGLGMLAGDHLKSASELGVPLVGVGLLYQKGYFRQYLSPEGWQQERYPINDFYTMPLLPFRDGSGEEIRFTITIAGRQALIKPWRVQVGRVTLVLLDTNLAENPPDIQDITDDLYGGDTELRIRQEVVLGIGGMRALDAVGLRARVYHMNEGHSAFVAIERLARLMRENNLALPEAWEIVAASTVFTTHTPVPAGIDVFPPELVERYLGSYLQELGASRDLLLGQGRIHPGDQNEPLNMAVTAIRLSGYVNGVSRLHGKVARAMWRDLWPAIPVDELPISYITNGVHPASWISEDMRTLYDRYLGPTWAQEPGDTRVWQAVQQIPGEELWRTHERRRERLVAFARRRLAAQLSARSANQVEIAGAADALDPDALTIGFARRFATYKRATMLLRDPERLDRLLGAAGKPVQIIFAGKAHPRDDAGKAFIRDIVRLAQRPEFRRRVVFLEDYDMVTARYLVQGCDVWLNTPRRPREASGTSGMKAAFNGVLNLSILDGWWDEGYQPGNGWAIGNGEEFADQDYQDRVEAGALYDLLEREVVPLFYTRASDGVPRGWIEAMKLSMQSLCPVFNTNRMVHQYLDQAYMPAQQQRSHLEENGCKRARALARWRGKVRKAWASVHIVAADVNHGDDVRIGDSLEVTARVAASKLAPSDLCVQIYAGHLDDHQEIGGAEILSMSYRETASDGTLLFAGNLPCTISGLRGFTVRVVPCHEDLIQPHATGLITWAS
jgi:glycogen phosphorylase